MVLDPVLHVTSGTVLLVVELESVVVPGADDEPGVGTQLAFFQASHHPARVFPRLGLVLEAEGLRHFFIELPLRRSYQHHGHVHFFEQTAVLADADDVIDVIPVAPIQNPWAIKAAVTTEYDTGIRPVLPDKLHQQRQNGPAVAAVTAIAGAQVTDQEMATTKHVQREVAMVVVVAIEELAGLIPVDRNIGTVKVQHDLLGWFVMLLDEVVPEQFMGLHHRLPVCSLLHPA